MAAKAPAASAAGDAAPAAPAAEAPAAEGPAVAVGAPSPPAAAPRTPKARGQARSRAPRHAAVAAKPASKGRGARRQGRTEEKGPRPAAPGRLTFNAKPWCTVSLGDRVLGPTPLARVEVPAGKHEITCTHPKLGTRRLVVTVPPGGEVRRVVTLGEGELKIIVKPWAKVQLDGRDLGTTPLPPQQLPAGRHIVVLENPDKGFRKRYTVSIDPGKTRILKAVID